MTQCCSTELDGVALPDGSRLVAVWSIDSVESEVWNRAGDDYLEICAGGLQGTVIAGEGTLPVETCTSSMLV